MRSTFRYLAVGVATASLLFSGACEKAAPTPPAPTPVNVTETFTGTLQPSGEAFYSFGMSVAGNVSLSLVSMSGADVPSDALFPMGIGQPVGTGCTAGVDAAAKPDAGSHLTAAKAAGFYCVRVADNARLGASATFLLNITHPR